VRQHIQSGGFVSDLGDVVAWRLIDAERIEIVPFEMSGLVPRVWR